MLNKVFGALALLAISKVGLAACNVDPAYAKLAQATGGTIMCAESGKVPDISTVSSYSLSSGNLEFLAGWKILGHGSLDRYFYQTRELPRDGVYVNLRNFPHDKLRVTKLYAIDSSNRQGRAAVALPSAASEPGALRYKLPTGLAEFKLVLEGTSRAGSPFTLYSEQSYRTSRFTDQELGKQVWKDVWKTPGLGIPPERQRDIEKAAFSKAD